MNELTLSNSRNSVKRLFEMVAKAQEASRTINQLAAIGNKTASELINEQKLINKYAIGYVLGSLKANLDCMPDDLADCQKLNGIPLDLLIKMKIDELVLDVRETYRAKERTFATDYERKYRNLSESICGFGYNMSFIEERFEEVFPKGTHKTVLGFAVGYSETFREIAAQASVKTEFTDPKTQDIWKNWQYFLKRDVHEYRLDGKYIFMYHGGFNCSGDKSIPYGDNSRCVNMDVYAALKTRNAESFVKKPFDFDI